MSDRIEIKDLDLLETVADDDEIAVQRKADGVVYRSPKSEVKGDKGDAGDAATVDAGTTTTGAVGTNASVVNSGTTSAAVFDFTIPRGDKGEKGEKGEKGDTGDSGDDAYVYIAYASDDQGTDFTLTFNPTLNYIAILSTDTEIATPTASDFTGLWKELAFNQNVFNFQRIAQTGVSPYEALTGDVNGTNTVFTVPDAKYITGTLQVYLNGKLVIPNVGWTETTPSSGTFTFADAPLTGDVVTVVFQDTEVSEGSVVTEPAGENGQIQFNDDGVLGGDSVFTFTKTGPKTITLGDINIRNYTTDGGTIWATVGDLEFYSGTGNKLTLNDGAFQSKIELGPDGVYILGDGRKILLETTDYTYDFLGSAGNGILDFSNIATTNKTFTFPNVSGTVGVVSGDNGQLQFNNDGELAGAGITYTVAGGANTLLGDTVFGISVDGNGAEAGIRSNSTYDVSVTTGPTYLTLSNRSDGRFGFRNNNASQFSFLDFSNIATSNKTFTFPNATGTVGTVITKETTGDPSETIEGLFAINTEDNNFKVYANGGWRTITTW